MSKHLVRVLIADDHNVVREGLVSLLSVPRFGIEVVGEAANGREAVSLALALRPDVVVLDLDMPEMDGVEVIRRILAAAPSMRILVLTGLRQPTHAAEVIRLGARGFLLKDAPLDDLIRAIRSIANGQVVIPAEVASQLLGAPSIQPNADDADPVDALTPREMIVLSYLAKGMSNKEIAAGMDISTSTVRAHVHVILGKLGVSSRTQAALYAVKNLMLDTRT